MEFTLGCAACGFAAAKPQAAALHIHLVVKQFRHGMAAQRFHDFAQDSLHVVRLVAHHGDPEDRDPAIFLALDLCHRHVEIIPEPILDTLNYLPLILQAATFTEQQTQTEGTDDHSG
jgi:hypothetical protein